MNRLNRQIRLGMVGGGEGALIGEVHRMAARLDNRYQLVAGAFSSDPMRCRASGRQLGIDPARCYDDFVTMAQQESSRNRSDRQDGIEAVVIVTPNHLHHAPARAFLQAGIHVLCDKPLASTLEHARELQDLVEQTGLLFAVTYNYSGYPMVRQARAMIANGELGALRIVQVEYPQDWLSTDLEASGHKQAVWRTDPDRAGPGGSLGDIGTHAYHLTEFVTGLQVHSVLADLKAFVPGRRLDDNAQVLLRFSGGARGFLWASQVAVGHGNSLRLRVYGETASLEWFQEQPDQLRHAVLGEAPQVISRGSEATDASARQAARLPGGHPEGYLEAFANLYRDFADRIVAGGKPARSGLQPAMPAVDGTESGSRRPSLVPDVEAGVRGVQFVETAVASANQGGVWCTLD